jgi:hypothetical protein
LFVKQLSMSRRMAFPVVLLLLVPYAVPLLMPSWWWLLAYAVAIAVTLAFTIWFHAVMMSPTRTGLAGIGLVLPISAASSTAAGTIVRTIMLIVRARFVVVAINILGAILLTICASSGPIGRRAVPRSSPALDHSRRFGCPPATSGLLPDSRHVVERWDSSVRARRKHAMIDFE